MRPVLVALLLSMFSATAAWTAGPQNWPSRPVKFVVPFAPAGPSDVMARLIAQQLSDRLGQQFIVENKAGAGGNIGMVAVAHAQPDGYTLLVSSSSYVINPNLYAHNPYDPFKDFTPVMRAAYSPSVLLINPSIPATNVKELAELIRKEPEKYSIANPGIGTMGHLASELLKLTFKLDCPVVPFGGAGPAVVSVMAGHTPIAFSSLPPAVPLIAGGQLKALAVTTAKRSALLPNVPTMQEAGAVGQESETIQGIFLPGGASPELVAYIHGEIAKVLALPDIQEKSAQMGFEVVSDTPEEFTAYIKAQVEKWARVIADAKIQKIE